MDNKYLTSIFSGKQTGNLLDEITTLVNLTCSGVDDELIQEIHTDVSHFFAGTYAEFKKSTLPYHNLRHTQLVVLATARLFHGLSCSGVSISTNILLKGLIAAYFHDTGLLLTESDEAQSGTDYLAGHETRSIQYLDQYAVEKGWESDIPRDCAVIIQYTDLNQDPTDFEPHDQDLQTAGQVVGSADILAQMADRYYLECLPLLYDELEAGGVNRHNSALELMEHTANFYHNIVLKRLAGTLSNTSDALQSHFKDRFTIDRNLYIENIDNNIQYLKDVIAKCKDIECLEQYLKRKPPTI